MERVLYEVVRRGSDRVIRGGIGRRVEDGEEELRRSEVKKVLEKLKKGKAVGTDGVPNEVWKRGGGNIEEWIWDFCNRVWRGERWPEQWKDGIIVPLVKKGTGVKVEDYRGITLMPTLYKVYVGNREVEGGDGGKRHGAAEPDRLQEGDGGNR